MPQFIHTSDLHLSAKERKYSLDCLTDISDLARTRSIDFVLASGDLFDSPQDAKSLIEDATKIIENSGCDWFVIPGNHDPQEGKFWSSREVGHLKIAFEPPFRLFTTGKEQGREIEILSIPHSENYPFRTWEVPPKKSKYRICVAHGTVPGSLPFTDSIEEESGGGLIEPGLFIHLQCDYAALGHIHKPVSMMEGSVPLVYSGSPRVWRKGETGTHSVLLVSYDKGFSYAREPIKSAGTYRPVHLPVNFDGEIPALDIEMIRWDESDYVELFLHGVVEDETSFLSSLTGIEETGGKAVRKFVLNHERIRFLPGISDNPMARDFLDRWQRAGSTYTGDQDREAWLRAREIALELIANLLEAKS